MAGNALGSIGGGFQGRWSGGGGSHWRKRKRWSSSGGFSSRKRFGVSGGFGGGGGFSARKKVGFGGGFGGGGGFSARKKVGYGGGGGGRKKFGFSGRFSGKKRFGFGGSQAGKLPKTYRNMRTATGSTTDTNDKILHEVKRPSEAPRHEWWREATATGASTPPAPTQKDFN